MDSALTKSENPSAGLFWKALLVSCLIVIFIIGIFNFLVNPYGLYPPAIFPQITDSIYEYKIQLLSEFNPPPEALILGSSRVQCIDPEIVEEITGRRCFNWALWESRTEILYASLRIALEEFHAPIDLVIVGVEPEMFHPTSGLHPQARTTAAYIKYFERTPFYKPILDKTVRMISFDQLIGSLKSIRRALKGIRSSNERYWRSDGFRQNMPGHAGSFSNVIQQGLVNYPIKFWKPDEFTHLSDARIDYWRKFLDICEQNHIQVIAYLQPVHPELMERLYGLGAEPIYEETAELVESTVTAMHGTYRDFRYLDSFGGNKSAFWDETHMLPNNGDLLIRELLSDFNEGSGSVQE
jgi:hypothetical protein